MFIVSSLLLVCVPVICQQTDRLGTILQIQSVEILDLEILLVSSFKQDFGFGILTASHVSNKVNNELRDLCKNKNEYS